MTDSTAPGEALPETLGGLPEVAPDVSEQDHADEIDNVVPSRGYASLPVVALGGSAGSIPALYEFLRNMPATTGIAYVVVLHLSPEHESLLPQLLQTQASIAVQAAVDGERLEADRVYVIPPGKHLTAVDGELRLSDLVPQHGKRVAVDLFLRSLADTHGAHAVAVILSGADGDGAIGIKRIKERGGLTIAQDPQDADHPSMPESAIATGMVDWILPVPEMPGRIASYVASERLLHLPSEEGVQPARPAEPLTDSAELLLREVLEFLHLRTGCDFSYYKRATIVRRIARRLQVNSLTNLGDYLTHLRTHAGEAAALLQDLLISVTNFFRDRDAFQSVEEHIPELFRDKQPGDAVRVWCAACATGEEVYSMAMLLCEHAESLQRQAPTLQVFGCDLDEKAIQIARTGFYPDTISADVSDERLRRFFTKETGGWRVRRELREMVLFANHDLLKDAPFSRIDLVSCRNLLIYLDRDAQARALEIFNFALKPNGLLFLGASESIEDGSPLFTPVHKKHRIFRHRPVKRSGLPVPLRAAETAIQRMIVQHERLIQTTAMQRQPIVVAAAPPPSLSPVLSVPPVPVPLGFSDQADAGELHFWMLGRWGPASLIVNAQHDVVHASANAKRFLQIPEGKMTRHLLDLVHPTLRVELRAALLRAAEIGQPVELSRRRADFLDESKAVDVRIIPAGEKSPGASMVMFEIRGVDASSADESTRFEGLLEPPAVAEQLERELTRANDSLQTIVEQYETQAEEFKASNEELQAMNEELRSAGEELETGREELQSVNEELTTVNTEFRSRVEELARVNSDLQNLMSATQIATVFLGRELEVMRYTPSAAPLFNLIPSDIGRPIAHLNRRLEYPELSSDAERTLRTLVPVERELREDGHWYLARVQPYRTVDDHIAGVVLTFVDITERHAAEQALRESEEQTRTLSATVPALIWRNDAQGRNVFVNQQFLDFTGTTSEEIRGTGWQDFVHPETGEAYAAEYLEAVRTRREWRDSNRIRRHDGEWRWFDNHAKPLFGDDGGYLGHVGVMIDITEQRLTEDALRKSEEAFRLFVTATSDAIYWMNGDWSEMRRLQGKQFLADTEHPSRHWFEDYIPPDQQPAVRAAFEEAVRTRSTFELEHRIVRADGETGWVFSRATPLLDERGEIVEWFGAASDITEQHRSEDASYEAKERLRLAVEASDLATWEWDLTTDTVRWNERHFRMLGMKPKAEPIAAREFFRHVHAGDQERVGQKLRQAVSEKQAFQAEFRVVREDGEMRWMSGYGRVTRLHGDGRSAVMSGVMIDITNRRQAEEALSESRERLQLIVDNAYEYAMITMTVDRRITGWSPGAQRIYGHSPEAAIGSLIDILFTPEDRAAGVPQQEATETLRNGRARDERWHLRLDGTRFWGSGIVALMHDSDGASAGLMKICRDQTDELRVREALQAARDQAQISSDIKDRFLALLSHELRTPLTPVMIATQIMARDRSLSAAAHNTLGIIQRNVRLEISLVDELLDVTRIAAGKLEIARAPVRLREVISLAVEVSSPDIEAKSQRLSVDLAEGDDALEGDSKRLQQAVWNLLKNASKFTSEGGTIGVLLRLAPGRAVVEVRDSGIGFEPEAAARIFQPFEQADQDVTRKFGGLGLGLAIARANIEAHGGTIQASSQGIGKGAAFKIELPLPSGSN